MLHLKKTIQCCSFYFGKVCIISDWISQLRYIQRILAEYKGKCSMQNSAGYGYYRAGALPLDAYGCTPVREWLTPALVTLHQ